MVLVVTEVAVEASAAVAVDSVEALEEIVVVVVDSEAAVVDEAAAVEAATMRSRIPRRRSKWLELS